MPRPQTIPYTEGQTSKIGPTLAVNVAHDQMLYAVGNSNQLSSIDNEYQPGKQNFHVYQGGNAFTGSWILGNEGSLIVSGSGQILDGSWYGAAIVNLRYTMKLEDVGIGIGFISGLQSFRSQVSESTIRYDSAWVIHSMDNLSMDTTVDIVISSNHWTKHGITPIFGWSAGAYWKVESLQPFVTVDWIVAPQITPNEVPISLLEYSSYSFVGGIMIEVTPKVLIGATVGCQLVSIGSGSQKGSYSAGIEAQYRLH